MSRTEARRGVTALSNGIDSTVGNGKALQGLAKAKLDRAKQWNSMANRGNGKA